MQIYQVDAFADGPFRGNPAAVCLCNRIHDDAWMQSVAMEMNLSETAFVRKLDQGYELRWFTPAEEVDLCGHATLASAHVLWDVGIEERSKQLEFQTRSGVLTADWIDDRVLLNFPSAPAHECPPDLDLAESIGVSPQWVGRNQWDYLYLLESADQLRQLEPDFRRMRQVTMRGVIVTSPADDPRFDFMSRFFAPAQNIDEDPVTGSAHCCLAPFWQARLGKSQMAGFQASPRGGVVGVHVKGDRVELSGQAVTVLKGELLV